MRSGIKLKQETLGSGDVAGRGATIQIRYQLRLNRGEILQASEVSTFTIGKREVIAGLEYAVEGMCVGGNRTVQISPHLAYRDEGVAGAVPPNAVLVFELELLKVEQSRDMR